MNRYDSILLTRFQINNIHLISQKNQSSRSKKRKQNSSKLILLFLDNTRLTETICGNEFVCKLWPLFTSCKPLFHLLRALDLSLFLDSYDFHSQLLYIFWLYYFVFLLYNRSKVIFQNTIERELGFVDD